MATIKFLQERIQKAQETITKKQNTITKKQIQIQKKEIMLQTKFGVTNIESAKWDRTNPNHGDIYWTICDIENLQDDIIRGSNEISEKQEALKKYQEELQRELEKAASRDVKVILEFLDMWKQNCKDYYTRCLPKWIKTLNEYREVDRQHCEWHNHGGWKESKEVKEEWENRWKAAQEAHKVWNFMDRYIITDIIDNKRSYRLDMDKIQKDLDYEANCKYDFIIERTNKIVGQITDASGLSIGSKGDLNGFIIGTRGVAKVQTIGAGGWNIQCFHFRTLINEA